MRSGGKTIRLGRVKGGYGSLYLEKGHGSLVLVRFNMSGDVVATNNLVNLFCFLLLYFLFH